MPWTTLTDPPWGVQTWISVGEINPNSTASFCPNKPTRFPGVTAGFTQPAMVKLDRPLNKPLDDDMYCDEPLKRGAVFRDSKPAKVGGRGPGCPSVTPP